MHCLNRTPSTRKSQLGSNYTPVLAPVTTINRYHYIAANNPSEIIQIKAVQNIDEVRHFACRADDMSSFVMVDHNSCPSVVKLTPSYDTVNFSCSQQTNTTTLSRDNSCKCVNLKNVRLAKDEKVSIKQEHVSTTLAERLRNCTKRVLTFKTEASSCLASVAKTEIMKKPSNDSMRSGNTISNSSLKEIDEEEFTSTELAQMMHEKNSEILHVSAS